MNVPAKRRAFLAAFAKTGNITVAAQKARVDRTAHYVWLKDSEYRAQYEAAREHACDLMVEEARRRAVEGWDEPVIYQGELSYPKRWNQETQQEEPSDIPLAIRKFDSTLLMFLIKGARPDVYRDNWSGEIKHTGNIDVAHRIELTRLNDAALDQLEAMFRLPAPDGGGGSIDAEADEE